MAELIKNGDKNMIYAFLPTGSFYGWGVCGKYIVKELSKITEVKLITEDLDFADILDEFDYRLLKSKLISQQEYEMIKSGINQYINFPVLQGIMGNTLKPKFPNVKGIINVGYTFFENNILPESFIENGKRYFDIVVCGSTWCENILRSYGLENVKTIIQGIDPSIFNPFYSVKEYFKDKFVVFSGGKFELRKGQDIVIKAFKILQDKYKDVILVNSWFNHWPFCFNTMRVSPHIKFDPVSTDYITMINQILNDNGIDINRVITLPLHPNIMMARIYKNSDIGLFPNRCEGGTNLVLMEYMACGRPVIASYNSGHKDILTDKNSIRLLKMGSMTISENNHKVAIWDDPNIDEIIDKLEWCYNNRDALKEIGKRAGEDLSKITWERTAQCFYDLLKS